MGVLTIATLLLFVGATGKSAQIPLYVWLPDAMEGPTPVSALIHAATMVTAGVYMIGRNAVLFEHAPMTLAVVAAVGVATALMAGTIGLVQNDIKRVLAYSTVSQLGYMFLAMGVGAYAAGIFHLYTHAFFKALLFLGSGAVIHALAGEQDLRNMGGLKKYLPITYWTFLIGALAIAGVPLLSGFFSKDEILFETFTGESTPGHTLLWVIGVVTSLLTATYMFRLVFLTFHGERRHDAPAVAAHRRTHGDDLPAKAGSHAARGATPSTVADMADGHGHGHGARPHDAPWSMAMPLIVLAVGSIVAGYVGVPHALGGSNRIETFLDPSFEAHATAAHERRRGWRSRRRRRPQRKPTPRRRRDADAGTELMLMALSSGIALAGIGIAAYFWLRNRSAADRMAQRSAVSPAAAQQVLRRRDLRRADRAADQGAVERGAVAGRRRRVDRRRRQRRRGGGQRQQQRAAAAADRLGPHLRVCAVRRRGGDPRLLPVQINDAAFSHRLSATRRRACWCCSPAAAATGPSANRSCATSRC